jgi:hypothetical protein
MRVWYTAKDEICGKEENRQYTGRRAMAQIKSFLGLCRGNECLQGVISGYEVS